MSEDDVKEGLFYLNMDIKVMKDGVESERWKHFVQWDILEAIKEFVESVESFVGTVQRNTKY